MSTSDGNLSATATNVFIVPPLGVQGNRNSAAHPADSCESKELSHSQIPPRKTIVLSIEYCVRGRGLPLPYELAEDLDE